LVFGVQLGAYPLAGAAVHAFIFIDHRVQEPVFGRLHGNGPGGANVGAGGTAVAEIHVVQYFHAI
jgi:hypothetical protein